MIIRSILMEAARRVASDPELRARAVDIARREVAPRARDAAQRAGTLTRAERERFSADLEAVRREAPPGTSNAELAGRLARRISARLRGDGRDDA